MAFTAFVVVKGIPTLRHDWNWPIDARAIPSFFNESAVGWIPSGFGVANSHPTTYLLALPLTGLMFVAGTLAGLAVLAFATGYCCMRAGENAVALWGGSPAAAAGIGLFALFNPWVYNEVVAGHLVMVLAYGAFIGMLAEMARGAAASSLRLALWLILIETQLQFFVLAACAIVVFAAITKKWLPVVAGALVVLPTAIGLFAERGTLLQTPYSLQWQVNQSVAPLPLLWLGGYFPGYADRLGLPAQVAVWIVVCSAIAGLVCARRSKAALLTAGAGLAIYLIVLGDKGPLAPPYELLVRRVPESGVFRELYDLAGIFAALLALLAAAAAVTIRPVSYLLVAAGVSLIASWALHPPSAFWVGAQAYPHPAVVAAPYTRVALLPAFQPLRLRGDGGNGADPDLFLYPGHVAPLNEYLPSYPVDAALARYVQDGDVEGLRSLGVGSVIDRPWLASRSNGAIGLAATSLQEAPHRRNASPAVRALPDPAPLVARCDGVRVVAAVDRVGACDIFLGDAPGYPAVRSLRAPADSVDPRTAWIDARLAFARVPELAQGLGGVLTQSSVPFQLAPNSWLLAFLNGSLRERNGAVLASAHGAFVWIYVPASVQTVYCSGLCELVAESPSVPAVPRLPEARQRAADFTALAPWLLSVRAPGGGAGMLRFDERYDTGWVALQGWRVLPHVRVALAVNGWLLRGGSGQGVLLVQFTALLQLIAEIAGVVCAAFLLKALAREPTKRG